MHGSFILLSSASCIPSVSLDKKLIFHFIVHKVWIIVLNQKLSHQNRYYDQFSAWFSSLASLKRKYWVISNKLQMISQQHMLNICEWSWNEYWWITTLYSLYNIGYIDLLYRPAELTSDIPRRKLVCIINIAFCFSSIAISCPVDTSIINQSSKY